MYLRGEGRNLNSTVAPVVTGIAIVDSIIDFVQKNLILVAVAVGAFIYFDPFDMFGKKKRKGGKK